MRSLFPIVPFRSTVVKCIPHAMWRKGRDMTKTADRYNRHTDDGGGKKTADSAAASVSQDRPLMSSLSHLFLSGLLPLLPLFSFRSMQAKQGEISLIVFPSCIVQWRKGKCSGLGGKMDARGWFAALLLEGSSKGGTRRNKLDKQCCSRLDCLHGKRDGGTELGEREGRGGPETKT